MEIEIDSVEQQKQAIEYQKSKQNKHNSMDCDDENDNEYDFDDEEDDVKVIVKKNKIPNDNKVIDEIKVSEKLYGAKWFYTVMQKKIKERHEKNGCRVLGPKEKSIEYMKKKGNEVLICKHDNKGYHAYGSYKNMDSFIDALETTPKDERHFFEVISGASKIVADIEGSIRDFPVIQVIKKTNKLFKQAFDHFGYEHFDKTKMMWSNASREGEYTEKCWNADTKQFETKTKKDKMSLHVVYNGDIGTHNIVEQKSFFEYVKEQQKEIEWGLFLEPISSKGQVIGHRTKSIIDMAIYTTDREFRTVLSSKTGSKRYLRPCDANGDKLDDYDIPDYLCQYKGNRFLNLPSVERVTKNKIVKDSVSGSSVEYVSNVAINEAIKAVKNVTFAGIKGNLILLRNVGVRTCIIGGETNESDNCYLVNKRDGLYFRCHDDGCVGKDKCVYSYREYKTMEPVSVDEELNFSNEQIELLRSWCRGGDSDVVKIFKMLYKDRIKAVSKDLLYYWNGRCWQESNTSIVINLLADIVKDKVYKMIFDLLNKLMNSNPETKKSLEEEYETFTKCYGRLGSSTTRFNICKDIMARLYDKEFINKLDTCPYLRTFLNGVVNLQTGEILPFSPEMYLSKCIKFEYKTEFENNVKNAYKLFFDNLTLGDNELLDFVQDMLGYCMTNEVSEQCFFILNGDGSNGKSALSDLIEIGFGEFYEKGNKKVIYQGMGSNAEQYVYKLRGKSICAIEEGKNGAKLDEEIIKELSGAKQITAKKVYCDPVTFTMTAKIMLLTNYLPIINSEDPAMTRRVICVPFNAKFCDVVPKNAGDIPFDSNNPKHRLKNPSCVKTIQNNIEYFIWWVCEGAKRWYSRGEVDENGNYICGHFNIPEAVKIKTNEYIKDNDKFSQFVDEYCEVGSDKFVVVDTLYSKYKFNTSDDMSKDAFTKMLSKRGYAIGKKRVNGVNCRVRIGIGLIADNKNDFQFD